MDEVAAEARVSRATAYRYFPSIERLLVEAPLDGVIPRPEQIFPPDDTTTDPLERIDRAEAALHDACYRSEPQLRAMLAASVARTPGTSPDADPHAVPVRQNRRTPIIEAALAPARRRFAKRDYERLRAALALIFGTEAMIVFQDVLAIDPRSARAIKSWAARALVAAALRESRRDDPPESPRRKIARRPTR